MATWTYTTTPFDDIARLRLMIGDTDVSLDAFGVPTVAQFSDEELIAFLTMASGSLLMAAAFALEAWAAAPGGDIKAERIGDYSYTKEGRAAMAKEYKKQAAETPYLTWAEMDLTSVPDGVEMGE